eukprot:g14047.t1
MAASAGTKKRRAPFQASGAVTPLVVTAAVVVVMLLRCSQAFVGPPTRTAGGVVGTASKIIGSKDFISSGRGARAPTASIAWTSIDARRERMATLSQVHWGLPGSGSGGGGGRNGGRDDGGGQPAGRASRKVLGSATALRSSSSGNGGEEGGGRGATMGAVRKGAAGAIRRAVARVLKRGGGGRVASAAAVAGGVSRSNAPGSHQGGGTGAAPPPTGTPGGALVDVDDVVQRSHLLLKDEDGPGESKRVLILMSDTGGGHRASAQALKAAFDELYPGLVNVEICDIWTKHAPWPLNKFVEAYQFMAKRPPIWKAFWEYGRFPLTRRVTDELTNLQVHKRFRSALEDYNPDLVVSVHPLCQEIPLRVMKKMGGGSREVPFVTVVTDLGGAHPTWFHRDVDACFVPSDRLATLAHKCGLSPEQIRLHGLPIRPGFWGSSYPSPSSSLSEEQQQQGRECSTASQEAAAAAAAVQKANLQEKLGLKPGVKACLVVGGGDGVGGLQGIADSVGQTLAQQGGETQVVVVCGKNDAVKDSLERGNWASNVHMHVKGFVSNMDEWMGAVDCIVTKAGPGTIAEAMIRGLPIMLSAFLPGQEAGNVPFVTEGGFGAFSKDPAKIADTVCRWLRDDTLRAKMSAKAKEASRPQATYMICSDIGEMLFGKDKASAAAAAASARMIQRGGNSVPADAGLTVAA